MIQLTLYRQADDGYMGFTCKGHAGYADYGQDIICAGTSALVLATLQSIEMLTDDQIEASVEEESGSVTCRFQKPASKEAALLLDALVIGFEAIRDEYGKKYVSVQKKLLRK